MNLYKGSRAPKRTSLLVQLRLVSRSGEIIDEQDAWQALVDAFAKHPTIDVFQAETRPNLEETPFE